MPRGSTTFFFPPLNFEVTGNTNKWIAQLVSMECLEICYIYTHITLNPELTSSEFQEGHLAILNPTVSLVMECMFELWFLD